MEQLATAALLKREAQAWAQAGPSVAGPQADDDLIQAYLQTIAAQAQVSDEEARVFFEQNATMFGGATYDQVANDLQTYLLEDKRNEAVGAHVNSLSARTPVEVDATWVQAQAATALDTEVDRARRSGLPSVVDFGAQGCGPCDMMAPILQTLAETYAGRCNVLVVPVREKQVLGARYGVQSIPVQIFFDGAGQEVYRHVGFFAQEQLEAKLAEMGVQ